MWPIHDRLQPVQPLGQARYLAESVRGTGTTIAAVAAVDRQFHRPRPSARRRWKKGGEAHAIGRSRGGLSTKIHAVVDQDGLPVRLHITAGQASDKTVAPLLLDDLPPGIVVADRGYDSLALVKRVAARGGEAHIPTQSRVRLQRSVPPDLYRRRNLVERYFCKIKQFRRIATRFEKHAVNFLAAVALASTRIWLRSIEYVL
nr:IS5 family transposase [Celeribacter indicus]